jgi:hypothetical protein
MGKVLTILQLVIIAFLVLNTIQLVILSRRLGARRPSRRGGGLSLAPGRPLTIFSDDGRTTETAEIPYSWQESHGRW